MRQHGHDARRLAKGMRDRKELNPELTRTSLDWGMGTEAPTREVRSQDWVASALGTAPLSPEKPYAIQGGKLH